MIEVPGSRIPHVAIVSQLPPPMHGSTMMTLHLRDALEHAGAQVTIVDKRFSVSIDDVGTVRLGKALAVPELLARLVRMVRHTRPDVTIYFLTNRPASLLVDSLLVTALRLLRVPVVMYLHTVGYSALADRGWFWRFVLSHVLRDVRTVVTLGPGLVPDIAPFVDLNRIATIANIAGDVPLAITSAREQSARDDVRVLFLSNLLPEKGVDAFVRVAQRLVSANPDARWRFDVAGAGSESRQAELHHAVADAGLTAHLTVHGAVDRETAWRLLDDATVLVFPSTYKYEAQPLTIVEALAVGTPVVAYDIGGISDLVIDGTTGVLVPAGDESRLVSAVLALESDRGMLELLRHGAIAHHHRAHSAEAYAQAWERLLRLDSVLVGSAVR